MGSGRKPRSSPQTCQGGYLLSPLLCLLGPCDRCEGSLLIGTGSAPPRVCGQQRAAAFAPLALYKIIFSSARGEGTIRAGDGPE